MKCRSCPNKLRKIDPVLAERWAAKNERFAGFTEGSWDFLSCFLLTCSEFCGFPTAHMQHRRMPKSKGNVT